MPGIWPFNNVSTQNDYADAVTAQFPTGRNKFSLQVYNAGVYYKLLTYTPPASFYADPTEHFLAPVLAAFSNAEDEGLAAGSQFGGIMLRSAVAGTPAKVTVI